MPPPTSAAVSRSISLPSQLHPSFLSTKKSSSLFLHGSLLRTVVASLRRGDELNPSSMTFSTSGRRAGGSSVTRFAGERWWQRFRSDRVCFAAGERKWPEGGEAVVEEKGGRRGREADSMNKRNGSEKTKAEMDGGKMQLVQQKQEGSSGLLTLPTVLTLGRIAAVPLLVSSRLTFLQEKDNKTIHYLDHSSWRWMESLLWKNLLIILTAFHMNGVWATTATAGIFLLAALTDWLDGYLARKMQLGTAFGAFLDPVADKLMVAATLVLLCTKPLEVPIFREAPWLLTVPAIVIIGREITMSAVREWAAFQNSKVLEAVAVNNLGKWKTATQMTALIILLIARHPSLTGPSVLVSTGVFLLHVSAGLALWSLTVYMRKVWLM